MTQPTQTELTAAAALQAATDLFIAWQAAMWQGQGVQSDLLYAAWTEAERVWTEAAQAADVAARAADGTAVQVGGGQ